MIGDTLTYTAQNQSLSLPNLNGRHSTHQMYQIVPHCDVLVETHHVVVVLLFRGQDRRNRRVRVCRRCGLTTTERDWMGTTIDVC